MKTLASVMRWGGKAFFALLGITAILWGVDLMFEYGEGLADLSAAEMLFLLVVGALEWRFVVRCQTTRSKLGSAISQLAVLGGLTLIGAVIAAFKGDSEPSVTWQALAVLLAIHNSTPKPLTISPATENPV